MKTLIRFQAIARERVRKALYDWLHTPIVVAKPPAKRSRSRVPRAKKPQLPRAEDLG